jgi:hypothetical protein
MNDQQLKWGKRNDITQFFLHSIILKVSDMLCLDETQSFALADSYFKRNTYPFLLLQKTDEKL